MNLIQIYIDNVSKQALLEATAYGLNDAPKGDNLQVRQLSSRPSLASTRVNPSTPSGGLTQKQAAPTFTSSGMSRIDRRMAELDKYLKDGSLKLTRGPTGKFQFVDKSPKPQSSNSPREIASIQKKPETTPPVNPPVAGQLSKSDQAQLKNYGNVIPLDKPTEVKPPASPPERNYSSPRAQRNMNTALNFLDVATFAGPAISGVKLGAKYAAKKILPGVINKINASRVGKVDGDAGTIDYTSIPGLPKKPVPFNQIGINRGLVTKTSN